MKRISAEEFYNLVTSLDPSENQNYWDIDSYEKPYTRVIRSESSVDRCFDGYSGWSPDSFEVETYTETVKTYTLNLAKLLERKGYEKAIYPLAFPHINVTTEGCFNIFDSKNFDDEKLKQLQWCLKSDKIKFGAFNDIIKNLNKAQLTTLYESDILDRYKNDIFIHYPDCDLLRNLTTKMKKVDDASLKTIEDIKQVRNILNDIKNILENENLKIKSELASQIKETCDKKLIELSEKVFLLKEYATAEELYTQLINSTTEPSGFYLKRAMARYHQKNSDESLEDLNTYKKKTEEYSSNGDYWTYRGLIHLSQKNYKSSAVCLYKLARDAENIEKNRIQFIEFSSYEDITKILDMLLDFSKNGKSKTRRETCEKEYIIYTQLAANNNHDIAQLTLSRMLWGTNNLQAEMWLGKSAINNIDAQFELAILFCEKTLSPSNNHDYYFERMKTILKNSAQNNFEPSKLIMREYYQKLTDSFKTNDPYVTTSKKRKVLIDTIDENVAAFKVEPPFKIPRIEEPVFDVYLDSKHPSKIIYIPNSITFQMTQQVENAYKNDTNHKKRNYLAANLTIIFSNETNKKNRTTRLIRTIAIENLDSEENINIENVFYNYDNTSVKQDHKRKLESASAIYSRNSFYKDNKLDFFKSTPNKNYNPNTHKHSEYALYRYLSHSKNLEALLNKFIEKYKDIFKPGSKVYSIVIDIYSVLASCTDCKKVTLALQNDEKFLNKIQKILEQKGYTCLTKSKTGVYNKGELYILIRIQAGRTLKKANDPHADTSIIPTEKNLKKLNNQIFFHKIESPKADNSASDIKYLIFESGTNASRKKAGTNL